MSLKRMTAAVYAVAIQTIRWEEKSWVKIVLEVVLEWEWFEHG